MTFKLKAGEKLPRGMRRIARKQLDDVLELLAAGPDEHDAGTIHKARKGLKKLRAELRLLRHAVGDDFYRAEEGGFRAAGQALAGTRDAEVLLKTLQKLRDNHAGPRNGASFEEFARLLSERRAKSVSSLRGKKQEYKTKLRAAMTRVAEWPLGGLEWEDLRRGVQRSYKRGRNAFAEAKKLPTQQHLHEWRKRVKDLWYQLRMLQRARPGAMARLAEDAKQLSQRLGDDHDLAMLAHAARSAQLDPEEAQLLAQLVQARRQSLQKDAFKLGRRVYEEKSAAFGRRIARYAKAWRD